MIRYLTSLEATGWMSTVGTAIRCSALFPFQHHFHFNTNSISTLLHFSTNCISTPFPFQHYLHFNTISNHVGIMYIIINIIITRLARDVAERVQQGKLVVLIEGEGRSSSPMVISLSSATSPFSLSLS